MFHIRELRETKGINMKEAARLLNMPYTTYVNYEKGLREPTSEVLIQIADFYGVTIDYLVGRDTEIRGMTVSDHIDDVCLLTEVSAGIPLFLLSRQN